jgi:protein-L-isoaspartate(D-aspartate) O-methyltransferase
MISELRRVHGVRDERILAAMSKVRRHAFVPAEYRQHGDTYGDHPCPIGFDQTISQPFIVAYMTLLLQARPGDKVLEVGTGSGYQAAILAELGARVYSIEIVAPLADHACAALASEGYDAVHVLTGDGYKGWPEYAPFDSIIATCAPAEVPEGLARQLGEGGRMVLPVGVGVQRLVILRKSAGKMQQAQDIAVRFVPMVHGKEWAAAHA